MDPDELTSECEPEDSTVSSLPSQPILAYRSEDDDPGTPQRDPADSGQGEAVPTPQRDPADPGQEEAVPTPQRDPADVDNEATTQPSQQDPADPNQEEAIQIACPWPDGDGALLPAIAEASVSNENVHVGGEDDGETMKRTKPHRLPPLPKLFLTALPENISVSERKKRHHRVKKTVSRHKVVARLERISQDDLEILPPRTRSYYQRIAEINERLQQMNLDDFKEEEHHAVSVLPSYPPQGDKTIKDHPFILARRKTVRLQRSDIFSSLSVCPFGRWDTVTDQPGTFPAQRGSTITDHRGSTITDHRGRTITDHRGSTITDHRGRTITDHRGSTITDHRGSTVTDHRGRTVTDHRGSVAITDHRGSFTVTDRRSTITKLATPSESVECEWTQRDELEYRIYDKLVYNLCRRRSVIIRHKWQKARRVIAVISRFSRLLALKSIEKGAHLITFTDIGDQALVEEPDKQKKEFSVLDANFTRTNKDSGELKLSTKCRVLMTHHSTSRTTDEITLILCDLQCYPSFCDYPLAIQHKIARCGMFMPVEKRRVIIRQGHMAENWYFVVSGQAVETETIENLDGTITQNTVKFITAGMTFGEDAIVNDCPHEATVTTRRNMQLIRVEKEDFYEVFKDVWLHRNDMLQEHMTYIKSIPFMAHFPIELLMKHPTMCFQRYSRPNSVLVQDSTTSEWIVVVRSGQCVMLMYIGRTRASWRDLELELAHPKINIDGRPLPRTDTGPGRLPRKKTPHALFQRMSAQDINASDLDQVPALHMTHEGSKNVHHGLHLLGRGFKMKCPWPLDFLNAINRTAFPITGKEYFPIEPDPPTSFSELSSRHSFEGAVPRRSVTNARAKRKTGVNLNFNVSRSGDGDDDADDAAFDASRGKRVRFRDADAATSGHHQEVVVVGDDDDGDGDGSDGSGGGGGGGGSGGGEPARDDDCVDDDEEGGLPAPRTRTPTRVAWQEEGSSEGNSYTSDEPMTRDTFYLTACAKKVRKMMAMRMGGGGARGRADNNNTKQAAAVGEAAAGVSDGSGQIASPGEAPSSLAPPKPERPTTAGGNRNTNNTTTSKTTAGTGNALKTNAQSNTNTRTRGGNTTTTNKNTNRTTTRTNAGTGNALKTNAHPDTSSSTNTRARANNNTITNKNANRTTTRTNADTSNTLLTNAHSDTSTQANNTNTTKTNADTSNTLKTNAHSDTTTNKTTPRTNSDTSNTLKTNAHSDTTTNKTTPRTNADTSNTLQTNAHSDTTTRTNADTSNTLQTNAHSDTSTTSTTNTNTSARPSPASDLESWKSSVKSQDGDVQKKVSVPPKAAQTKKADDPKKSLSPTRSKPKVSESLLKSAYFRRKQYEVPQTCRPPPPATSWKKSQSPYVCTSPPVYVQIDTLTEGDCFGLDQLKEPGWDTREQSGRMALISHGAEVVMLNKRFFMSFADDKTHVALRENMHIYPTTEAVQTRYRLQLAWQLYCKKVKDELDCDLRNQGMKYMGTYFQPSNPEIKPKFQTGDPSI